MIFVDANVFLRFLTSPVTVRDPHMKAIVRKLFEGIRSGEVIGTTSEVVLHEVCFVLGAKSHYRLDATTISDYVGAILVWPGWLFPPGDKEIYLRALDIFAEQPKLEFSDSVIAARAEAMGAQLATFDERLARIPIVDRWVPAP